MIFMTLQKIIDIILHLDKYLNLIIQDYGTLTYLILFLIIFLETGLVIFPFLPGDSLLFAAGTFASQQSLNLVLLIIILILAAVLGDTLNYWIGNYFGLKLFNKFKLKKEYLEKTHKFYEKYGKKTIFLARFVQVVRTFAPFVAGVGKMNYFTFFVYNIIGGILWVLLFTLGGFYFGNLSFVKNNFTLVISAIILISIIPAIIEYFRNKSGQAGI